MAGRRLPGVGGNRLQKLRLANTLLGLVVIAVCTATLLLLSPTSRVFLRGATLQRQRCEDHAAAVKPSAAAAAALGFHIREPPPIDASAPVLAASNWEGAADKRHAALTRAELEKACGGALFRYRIVGGVVYADHNHRASTVLSGHRDTFVEMLLTALWLFKSFPSVDLWVSLTDEPSRCSLDVPVLQYAIIGLNVTRQAALHNLASEGGSQFSVTQLLTGAKESSEPAQAITDPAPKFYRGWGMGYPASWDRLSLPPDGLRAWQQCLWDKVGRWPYVAKVIWRGSNTGSRRGWSPLVGSVAQPLRHPWGIALTNKRMAVALLARSHPDTMDVGLHSLHVDLMGPNGKDPHLVDDLRQLLVKPYVPMDLWGRYAAQLSIDGHGSPDRLPLQYLQGSSIVLKMQSPYKDRFEELFKPRVHYEPVRYDLSDLLPRIKEVLQRFEAGDRKGLQAMAATAGQKAVEVFSILGQLDALMYAILKVKSVCSWEVVVPPLSDAATPSSEQQADKREAAASDWQVLVLNRDRAGKSWKSPSLTAAWAASVRASMFEQLAANLHATD